MVVSIPVYVEAARQRDGQPTVHRCRPLFFDGSEIRDEDLGRAMARLTRDLGEALRESGRELTHENLAAKLFSPSLETRQCKFSVDLRRHIVKCRFLFVSYAALGRVVAFTPSMPGLWFETASGERLVETAARVVAAHFARLVEREGWTYARLDALSLTGRAWVTAVEVPFNTRQPSRQKSQDVLAALFRAGPVHGDVELNRCGQSLDQLYPAELDRPLHRDDEIARLDRLLAAGDRRPVALVGPRMVGKTAIVHGAVRRREKRRRPRQREGRRIWLLAPQRLISGMSAVGQWEERLLAILDEARDRDHVLYFDDLLGLYRAGVSAESDLTVPDVLRAHVQRRAVRVLAEMTPEAFRAFAERDRGLADQFHVLRVEPLSVAETLQVLLDARRRLELRHRCLFEPDVLPAVVDVQRRYVRDAEFPGKAAAFLNQIALTHPRETVTRDTVQKQFHEQTGLALALLDGRRKLRRADVLDGLRRRVVGQEEALEAMTDVVSLAKARLNAPDRPLATLLFMGPTGVGKTECAKALAAFLFGREEHLVRLDMNEFGSPAAASRLVGTFLEPEGLLTAAVRRQPFCVVLLDEIEKAHPDVLDVLLQVMGEGRLTDAAGRTTDFSSAIVIMTSNLGTREVAGRIGFGGGDEERQQAFVGAAEDFFRPEFVNRIDRMVPFRQLGRSEMRGIAERLLEELIGREGLVRRRCVLNVDPRALDLVVDRGYQSQLGARALKRMLERQLVQPVSARLSTLKPDLPVLVNVHGAREDIVVRVSALTEVETVGWERSRAAPKEVMGRLEAALARVEDEISGDRPRGEFRPDALTPAQHDYLEVSALVVRLRDDLDGARDRYDASDDDAFPDASVSGPMARPNRLAKRSDVDRYKPLLLELASADDLRTWLREFHAAGATLGGSLVDARIRSLRDRTALVTAVHAARPRHRRTVLFLRGPGRATGPYVRRLGELYRRAFAAGGPLGADDRTNNDGPATRGYSGLLSGCFLDAAPGPARAALEPMAFLVVEGACAGPLVKNETGTHLMIARQGSIVPIQVGTLPERVSKDEEPGSPALLRSVREALESWDQTLQAWQQGRPGADPPGEDAPVPPLRRCYDDARRAWLERVDRGEAALEDDPFPLGPVVRIYDERSATVDLRTRISVARWPDACDLWTFLGSSLPLGDKAD